MKDFLIMPAEAVEVLQHSDGKNLFMAIKIRNAYAERDPINERVFSLGACFNAGIIEGVRRERARRKARKEGVRSRIITLLEKIKSEKALYRIYGYMLRHYDEEEIAYEHINSHIL